MKLHPHIEIPNATPTDSGSVLLSHVGILILYSKQLLSEKNRKYYILVYLVGSFLSWNVNFANLDQLCLLFIQSPVY